MIQSKNVNHLTFRAARYAAVLKGFYGCMQGSIDIDMDGSTREMHCKEFLGFIQGAPLGTPAPAAMRRRGLMDMDVHS